MLEQIRGGAQLKKVEQNHSRTPASNTGRDALLDQIRQGIQLKTVRTTLVRPIALEIRAVE